MDAKSISVSSSKQESGRRLNGGALIAVITALMLTLLLEALDQTVVGTALPKIIGSLQGFDRYTWAITAYTLASTTMIPVVGKLSDQFGRKWFLLVGTAIFLLGSALSGASPAYSRRQWRYSFVHRAHRDGHRAATARPDVPARRRRSAAERPGRPSSS